MGHDPRHPLDNVVWAALTGAHASFAQGSGLARHYPRDIAPFSAVAEPSARAYADLAGGLAAGVEARLFRPSEEPTPDGWETLSVRPIVQMVAGDVRPSRDASSDIAVEALTPGDVDEMIALAEVTKPGPFGPRTIMLGDYVGVRDETSRLVAMAGERFRIPGHVEVSAICVHPAMRGRALGRALALDLVERARERGETAFLHVFPDNPAAQLYLRWGFRERARHCVVWRRPLARS
ncbi:MAG TPA: GNAT family N-acetyltransferase [Xanthobacteraceae bacterium]|nr:GNAT family N-acetyltransferase [Xanthobacteraceae bacterium]